MSIFTTTISLKIENIYCYCLCKYSHEVFKEKKDEIHSLMISKNCRENDNYMQRLYHIVKGMILLFYSLILSILTLSIGAC